MKKTILNALVIAALFPFSLFASTDASLYEAELPVVSQADDERTQAVTTGFQQLLIRLTGDAQIEKKPEIKEAVSRANYFVEDFSYASPTPQSSTYTLHVRYHAVDINRLLHKLGIPYWGDARPSILVWVAVADKNNQVEIIGDDSHGNILANMRQQGDKFGLSLIYPLMDVNDMDLVSAADVTSMALPVLQKAGQRYSPNGYLIGKIAPVANGYESEWELIVDKNHWKWTLESKTIDDIIAEAMTATSQTLAKQFRVTG